MSTAKAPAAPSDRICEKALGLINQSINLFNSDNMTLLARDSLPVRPLQCMEERKTIAIDICLQCCKL